MIIAQFQNCKRIYTPVFSLVGFCWSEFVSNRSWNDMIVVLFCLLRFSRLSNRKMLTHFMMVFLFRYILNSVRIEYVRRFLSNKTIIKYTGDESIKEASYACADMIKSNKWVTLAFAKQSEYFSICLHCGTWMEKPYTEMCLTWFNQHR